jgi:hypothetical protein
MIHVLWCPGWTRLPFVLQPREVLPERGHGLRTQRGDRGTTIAPFRPHCCPLPKAINTCKSVFNLAQGAGSHSFGGEDQRLWLMAPRSRQAVRRYGKRRPAGSAPFHSEAAPSVHHMNKRVSRRRARPLKTRTPSDPCHSKKPVDNPSGLAIPYRPLGPGSVP